MDRMLVVVFDNEDKAIEASHALRELDRNGHIVVYDAAIVVKNPNGTTTMRRAGEYGLLGTLTGATLGSFIGILGGPLGVAMGAAGGTLIGALSDFENVRVGSDFIADAAKELVPGKTALVAEVDEEEITPVDTRMEVFGGHILRRSLHELKHAESEKDIAVMKAEIAHTKAEHAVARADRKAKLQARIDGLNAKLKQKTDQAKIRREARKRHAEAKIEALKAKAAQSKQDIKARHEQRVARAEKAYRNWVEDMESGLLY
jgi:uncharacterized membrane protein